MLQLLKDFVADPNFIVGSNSKKLLSRSDIETQHGISKNEKKISRPVLWIRIVLYPYSGALWIWIDTCKYKIK